MLIIKPLIITILFASFANVEFTDFSEGTINSISFINSKKMETATFAAGCFWCVEAVYENLEGVEKVTSGYSGGTVKNPSYNEVVSGRTGHAEAIQIMYDANITGYTELLEVFWSTHDPTTLNRQGADVGTQYRSAIFYHDENQKLLAEKYKKTLDESGAFPNPIVTEIVAMTEFYPAEDYHQDYYTLNPSQPYCRLVIAPKLEKFKKVFKDKLKKDLAN